MQLSTMPALAEHDLAVFPSVAPKQKEPATSQPAQLLQPRHKPCGVASVAGLEAMGEVMPGARDEEAITANETTMGSDAIGGVDAAVDGTGMPLAVKGWLNFIRW